MKTLNELNHKDSKLVHFGIENRAVIEVAIPTEVTDVEEAKSWVAGIAEYLENLHDITDADRAAAKALTEGVEVVPELILEAYMEDAAIHSTSSFYRDDILVARSTILETAEQVLKDNASRKPVADRMPSWLRHEIQYT